MEADGKVVRILAKNSRAVNHHRPRIRSKIIHRPTYRFRTRRSRQMARPWDVTTPISIRVPRIDENEAPAL